MSDEEFGKSSNPVVRARGRALAAAARRADPYADGDFDWYLDYDGEVRLDEYVQPEYFHRREEMMYRARHSP